MKQSIFYLFMFCAMLYTQAQEYIVIAPSGLVVREQPNGKRFGKIPYGAGVNVVKKLNPFSVSDNGKQIQGHWVQLNGNDMGQVIMDQNIEYTPSEYYTFNGFLMLKSEFIKQQDHEIKKYSGLKDFYLSTAYKTFALKGDFFGDGISDDLYRRTDTNGDTRLIIVNHQKDGFKIYGLGGAKDPFNITSYNFGILHKVDKQTPLWSNFTDDFREFKDVPKSEIVKLNYDAIYVHNEEACGGGYIFWKNGKWNWLQQE